MGKDLFGYKLDDNIKETTIQSWILEYLRRRNIFAWRNNNISVKGRIFTGLKGVADILGCLSNGKMLAIEVKSTKGKVSQDQKNFIDNINNSGGLAFIARSVDDVVYNLSQFSALQNK